MERRSPICGIRVFKEGRPRPSAAKGAVEGKIRMNRDVVHRTLIRQNRRHHLGSVSDESRVTRRSLDDRLYGNRRGSACAASQQVPCSRSELPTADDGRDARLQVHSKKRKPH